MTTVMTLCIFLIPICFLLGILVGKEVGMRNGMARALNLFPGTDGKCSLEKWKQQVIEEARLHDH